MATPQTPTGDFHLFTRLPTELRLKIYDYIQASDTIYPQTSVPTRPNPFAVQGVTSISDVNISSHLLPIYKNIPNPVSGHETGPISDASLPPRRRILQITYQPDKESNIIRFSYRPHIPAPALLSLHQESRQYLKSQYGYTTLDLGSASNPVHPPKTSIPVSFDHDTIYLPSSPSTGEGQATPFRPPVIAAVFIPALSNFVQSLAVNFRMWVDLSGHLVPFLVNMPALKELLLVVEFGREEFGGEVGFLEVPGWRGDLWVVSAAVEEDIEVKRGWMWMGLFEREKVKVRCVLLTRGGEQA